MLTYEGVITDHTTGQPLKDADVFLQKSDDGGQTGINEELVMSTKTDVNGRYVFHFYATNKKKYGIKVSKPSDCYSFFSGYYIPTAKITTRNYAIRTGTLLFIHLKNVAPFDENDHICYALSKNATECTSYTYGGMELDVVDYYFEMNLNEYTYIKSFVTKNGITTVKLDSVMPTTCNNIIYNLDF